MDQQQSALEAHLMERVFMEEISLDTASALLGVSYAEATSIMAAERQRTEKIQALQVRANSVLHDRVRTSLARDRG